MSGGAGPGRPPRATQFRKGQSGNPKGRPRRRRAPGQTGSAFDVIIDRTLTVTRGGVARDLTVEEALQLQTYRDALAGSRPARRAILKMIAKREAWLAARRPDLSVGPVEMVAEAEDPSNADAALLLLGIARRKGERPGLDTAREQLLLEPWAVQAALGRRRGGAGLDNRDVEEIRRCTHQPETLRWPRGTAQ
jgi:hypothetical protein